MLHIAASTTSWRSISWLKRAESLRPAQVGLGINGLQDGGQAVF